MDRRSWRVIVAFMVPVSMWAAVDLYVNINASRLREADTAITFFRLAKWSAHWLPWAVLASPMLVLLYLGLVGGLTARARSEPKARQRSLRCIVRAVTASTIAWLCFLVPAALGRFSTSLAWLCWGIALASYSVAAASALSIETDLERQGRSRLGRRGMLIVSVLAALIPLWAALVPLGVYVRGRRLPETT